MITLKNIALQRGVKPLLQDVNFSIYDKQKIGLVGANGAGKTSLFMLLSDRLQADEGELEIAKGVNTVTVKQEVSELNIAIIDYVMQGHQVLFDLQKRINQALNDEQYELQANLHADFEALGGYQLEARAAMLLDGLGFQTAQLREPVKSLSGGWRIRLNLAQALLQESDLLLLDEPTNHLDLDAVLWLEQYLKNYTGALVLISHDRIFLDNVVNRVLHIENKEITGYSGNYSAFEKEYHEHRVLQQKSHQKQQQKIEHLESFINRFKAKATKAKQAQSRMKMLAKMQRIEPVETQQGFSFSFSKDTKMPTGSLIELLDANLGYNPDQPILANIDQQVLPEMRIGLLGRNGAGKSTLVKSLVGELGLLSGSCKQHPDLKLGYFAQHSLDTLDFNATPLQHIQRLDLTIKDEAARKFLGRFNFNNDMALSLVGGFSGGEKARLALALIVYQKPNFLLLDEPTNHLDIGVREALAFALQSFEGALMLISHDRFLLESTVDEYWLVDDGQVQLFNGDLADYYQFILAKKKEQSALQRKGGKASADKGSKKQTRPKRAEQREKFKPLSNKIKQLEKTNTRLQQEKSVLDQKLEDEELYDDQEKLNVILQQHQVTVSKLEENELLWIELNDELEKIQSS